MSFRAIVEIILHFESIRNIDIFHQGVYYLQFHIFQHIKDKTISASPYNIYQSINLENTQFVAEISNNHYKSKGVYLRYLDEIININEIAVFRTEIELNTEFCKNDLNCVCELMFSSANAQVLGRDSEGLNKLEFTKESSVQVKISNPLNCANQYCPIIFDSTNLCIANCSFHILIIDYRFRSKMMIDESTIHEPKTKNYLKTLSEIFFPGLSKITTFDYKKIYKVYITKLVEIYKTNSALIKVWSQTTQTEELTSEIFDKNNKNDYTPEEATETLLEKIYEMAQIMNKLIQTLINTLHTHSNQITAFLVSSFNEELSKM